MIVNRRSLFAYQPIKYMVYNKLPSPGGVTYGLGEAGFDIRIAQSIIFKPDITIGPTIEVNGQLEHGRFTLASAIEEFDMPANLVGVVHDKSTWARQGLSVFNTVIEPGWKGFLTLELVFHGNKELIIPAGAGIAQVLFHELAEDACYGGKYNNQPDKPVKAILE